MSFRFLGIRYAPQPKRWTYSTAYKGNGSEANATAYGAQCFQSNSGGSEDCLFLNVWTPYLPAHGGASKKDLKPVLFWIHGGAFTSGSGNDPTFDGGNIVSRGDVVMVAINYRLSTLGFLALDDGVTRGNYGLGDQLSALDWVRANIQDFGGDPDRITIFGQSAGAASVRAIMASPKSTGKFKGAIPQSNLGGGGYGTTYSAWLSIAEQMATVSNTVLSATNCTTASSRIDCLRKADANVLVNAQARYLTVDGAYLNTSELVLDGTGKSLSDIHVMEGLMRDDGAAIISLVQTTNLAQSLTSDGFNATNVINSGLFPLTTTSNATLDVFNVTSRVGTDTIFRCTDQASAYAAAQNNIFAPNQYFYEFNRSYQTPGFDPNAPVCDAPISPAFPNGDPSKEYFKCHSGELYFEFGNILRMGLPLRDENDIPFSQVTLDYWSSFARTWNPNPDEAFLIARGFTNTSTHLKIAGEWEPVTSTSMTMRELQWPSETVSFRDVKQCKQLGWPLDYYIAK